MDDIQFADLPLAAELQRALTKVGYITPSPIQAQAIPVLLEGQDLLGVAQTGTGKTAAFSLPLLHTLWKQKKRAGAKHPRALILSPTRELASQIREEIALLGQNTQLRSTTIFGGVGQNPQVRTLAKGVDIVVATPGRLLDLMHQGHLKLADLSHLVLDEADRLLDMGFIRDVRKIVAQTPKQRQTLMFSATMPKEVEVLAKEILHNPCRIDVSPKQLTVSEIDQRVVMVGTSAKLRLLESMLREKTVSRAIVFTRTKHGANKVASKLEKAGIGAEAFHGNKSQNARQKSLANFKRGDAWVLVATDIAARGIDIEGVSHVFNYELPHEPESYVHRIGRTGRAGATGTAWSLVDPSERGRLKAIERFIKHTPTMEALEIPPPKDIADNDGNSIDADKTRRRQSAPRNKSGNRSAEGKNSSAKSRSRKRSKQHSANGSSQSSETNAGTRTPRRRTPNGPRKNAA